MYCIFSLKPGYGPGEKPASSGVMGRSLVQHNVNESLEDLGRDTQEISRAITKPVARF